MKKILIAITVLSFLIFSPLIARAGAMGTYVEVFPVTTSYEQKVVSGMTEWQVVSITPNKNQLGFWNNSNATTGISPCQVIDLGKMDIDGYFTFQLKNLTGSTSVPVSGTTINAYWRATNVDSPEAWAAAVQNPIFANNGVTMTVNAFSGTTKIGWDLIATAASGVTPFRYIRIEFKSGVSKEVQGLGGVTPVGLLFIR